MSLLYSDEGDGKSSVKIFARFTPSYLILLGNYEHSTWSWTCGCRFVSEMVEDWGNFLQNCFCWSHNVVWAEAQSNSSLDANKTKKKINRCGRVHKATARFCAKNVCKLHWKVGFDLHRGHKSKWKKEKKCDDAQVKNGVGTKYLLKKTDLDI